MDLNNRRHYQEMVEDMHSVSVMAHYRGDKAKEHEILCAACKRLLRHLGRRESWQMPDILRATVDARRAMFDFPADISPEISAELNRRLLSL